MARVNHAQLETTTSNPTSRYLEWKSNDKAFKFYDKQAGENVIEKLPMKFLFLQHYHTVKGFSDASNSGIFSNEVYHIGSQEMTVRSFKGGEIAKGLYKDIKPKVVAAGGNYHRSVYAMTEDGSIVNLSFKGAVVSAWSDFFSEKKGLLDNQWVEINEAEDKKKGSVKYSVPVFTVGKPIGKEVVTLADTAALALQDYLNEKFATKQIEVVEPETLADDLGF